MARGLLKKYERLNTYIQQILKKSDDTWTVNSLKTRLLRQFNLHVGRVAIFRRLRDMEADGKVTHTDHVKGNTFILWRWNYENTDGTNSIDEPHG